MPQVNPNVWGVHMGPNGGFADVSCNSSSFTAKVLSPPAGTKWIEYFIECQSTLERCKTQAPPRLSLSRSELTISDAEPPTAQPTDGDLPLGWSGSVANVTFAASDNVGIRDARLRIDGAEVAARSYPCDYTRLAPCGDVSGSALSANVSALSETIPHTWTLEVIDGAGNVTQSPAGTFWVDRTPPGAPSEATATFDPDTSEVEVGWEAARDPSPGNGGFASGTDVYTYRYRRGGGEWSGWLQTQAGEFTLAGGHDGEQIDVEVRATDIAGNVGPLHTGTDIAARSELTVESYGQPTGRDLSEIDFSEDDEPEDQTTDSAAPGARTIPPTASVAYREDNCSGTSPCGTYDHKAAARYARYWWSRRNKDYAFFGNDCTNFVSQALKAGGMRFIRSGGFNDPTPATKDFIDHYDHGAGSWWSARIPSGGWGWTWRWTRSFTLSQVSHDRMLGRNVGRRLLSAERPRAGDVIYYRLKGRDHDFSGSPAIDVGELGVRLVA